MPRELSPGPQDYNFDTVKSLLKTQPRVMFPNAKYNRSLAKRENSPGPQQYEPKRLMWKKRASIVAFNREKRHGIIRKESALSPGPGAYMLPCKFYERPTYATMGGAFRFV